MATPVVHSPVPPAVLPDAAIPATAQTVQAATPVVTATPVAPPAAAGPAVDMTAPGGLLQSLQLGSFGDFAEMLAIFFLVLGLVCVCLWLFRRIGGKYMTASTPRMVLEGRLSIGPKRWIMLVRVDSKRLILGLTDQHIVMLAELPDDSLAATSPDIAAKPSAGARAGAPGQGGGQEQLLDFSALLDEEGQKKRGEPCPQQSLFCRT